MSMNGKKRTKRILKNYDSPIIPQRSKDAIVILYEVGAIGDELYHSLSNAIGFRNSMIYDYMKFDDNILFKILRNRIYLDVYDFLIDDAIYKNIIIQRIKNYTY